MAACVLTTLPNELLKHITAYVQRRELASFRASCRLLNAAALQRFIESRFPVRYHAFTEEGLADLLNIVKHKVFAQYVRKIILTPDDVRLRLAEDHLDISMVHTDDDIFVTSDEGRLLRMIFKRLAPYGEAITVGVNTTITGGTVGLYQQLLALKQLRKMVLEAQTRASCTDIVLRIPVPPGSHPVAIDYERMLTLPNFLPLEYHWTKLIIEFFTEGSMTKTTGFIEHDRRKNTLRGESTSLYHMRKIVFFLGELHLEELTLTYCDIDQTQLSYIITDNQSTLKRLTLHSVSLYRGYTEEQLASDDHADWIGILQLISTLKLDYCSVEYLWDGPLAFVASEFITADDH